MEWRDVMTNLAVAAMVYGLIFAPLDVIREIVKVIKRGRMPYNKK